MCLVKVKEEEDYSVPARVVRRERRRSPPTERRSTRVSYVQPPRQPSIERTYIIQPPQPPPTIVEPPRQQVYAPPPSPPSAPSVAPEPRSRAHYVEVSPASVSSSASSSSEDVRSKTTSKSRRTAPGSEYHLREREYRRESDQSQPRRDDYEHYRYVRAPPERGSHDQGGLGRGSSREGARSSFVDDPRASRTSYKRERERVVVVGNDGRQTREYRR